MKECFRIKWKFLEYTLIQNDHVKQLFSVNLHKCFIVIEYNFAMNWKMEHSWSLIDLAKSVNQNSNTKTNNIRTNLNYTADYLYVVIYFEYKILEIFNSFC